MISGRKVLLTILFCFVAVNAFAADENSPPSRGVITHARGESRVGEEVIFTTTYVDGDGWEDLKYVRLIINTEVADAECFYAQYQLGSNTFSMKDDLGTQWIGWHPPGSDEIIENSYAKLDCSKSLVVGYENGLRVTWAVTFKEPMGGKIHNTYLYAKDIHNARTPWNLEGTWKVKLVKERLLRFQGILKDNTPDGALLDGDFNLTFRLYAVEEDGTALWEEVHLAESIENGMLDVELGTETPLDGLTFDTQYWLGVQVESDHEMDPRFCLTSVPYALRTE